MSDDLEQRLVDALTAGAQGAPGAGGLADAARVRARSRRRARLAGAAVLMACCIGVPTAVVAAHDSSGGGAPQRVATEPPSEPGVPDGFRVESWHSVSLLVPESWGHGSLSDWCAGSGTREPRVQRPATLAMDIDCPGSTYGIQFTRLEDSHEDFQWPVVQQSGGGYPDDAYVGARGMGHVLVWVVARTQEEGLDVLATMSAIGPTGDPYGCTSSRREAPPLAVPEGAMRLCRYDANGRLEQSELLAGDDAAAAAAALDDLGLYADDLGCRVPEGGVPGVWMQDTGIGVFVELAGNCPTVRGLGQPRAVSPDVLYWALSPGWSGDGTGLPLPQELRRQ